MQPRLVLYGPAHIAPLADKAHVNVTSDLKDKAHALCLEEQHRRLQPRLVYGPAHVAPVAHEANIGVVEQQPVA